MDGTGTVPRGCGLTRITIVEDHALFAEALDVALTLEGHDVQRVEIDDQAGNQGRLLSKILRSHPRIVLLDLWLGPSAHAAGLIPPLAQTGIDVVVVTGSIDRTSWGECLFHGARTVLPKSAPLNAILATIRLIGEGQQVLALEDRQRLLADFRTSRSEKSDGRIRLATLTERERVVLREMTKGRQVRQIARDSVVSEATVRTQVKSILAKLGVSSQLGAVALAVAAAHRGAIPRASHQEW